MNLIERIRLAYRVLTAETGNLMAHAEAELPPSDDEINAAMRLDLLEVVLVFGSQGHSGFSAGYARAALAKLLAFEPLGPLTGETHEWIEVGHGVFQNKRCGRLFKQADRFNGQAYDIDGIVWEDEDGSHFTNSESMVPVVFPYTPTTEYRKRGAAA